MESPKLKMPPSEATSQYPFPVSVGVMATTGRCSGVAPMEPWKAAVPNEKMPPSDPTSQYPWEASWTGKLCGLPVAPK